MPLAVDDRVVELEPEVLTLAVPDGDSELLLRVQVWLTLALPVEVTVRLTLPEGVPDSEVEPWKRTGSCCQLKSKTHC